MVIRQKLRTYRTTVAYTRDELMTLADAINWMMVIDIVVAIICGGVGVLTAINGEDYAILNVLWAVVIILVGILLLARPMQPFIVMALRHLGVLRKSPERYLVDWWERMAERAYHLSYGKVLLALVMNLVVIILAIIARFIWAGDNSTYANFMIAFTMLDILSVVIWVVLHCQGVAYHDKFGVERIYVVQIPENETSGARQEAQR